MTDFATYTNAQINRWSAERDPAFERWASHTRDENLPDYSTSMNVAIALLGRWGYEWIRVHDSGGTYIIYVWPTGGYWGDGCQCAESPECDTARALVIAANSLKESEEG
jgi:hypothetical protein